MLYFRLPAKTPSMPKESKAGASSRSTKTKTSKSTRKKKEVIVTEDETPKAKTSRKSVKSSQKKIQKEVGIDLLIQKNGYMYI